jgi:endogenous inhibitor of DNA gyrase (YacG/DUF329 family)
MTLRCPICEKPVAHAETGPLAARYRPFCSKRCADVDLQRLFSGRYAIPGEPEPDEPA